LWAWTLAAYSNSFSVPLLYDSEARIKQDVRVHAATAQNVSLIFHTDYWDPAVGTGLYRPLTTLSFLFNYAVLHDQDRPWGYHAVNWILHCFNVSLVYLLAWLLLGEGFWAAAVAGLWAVHPVLTESVTNIVGRADLLAGTGVLGGLLGYVLAARAEGRRRWMWWGASVVAVGVGMFSKESAVIVIPVVILYEAAFGRADWRTRLTGLAALAAPCAVYFLARYPIFSNTGVRHIPYVDNPIAGAGFFDAKPTAIAVIGKQMALLAWPARPPDYSYNQIPLASWGDLEAVGGLAGLPGSGRNGGSRVPAQSPGVLLDRVLLSGARAHSQPGIGDRNSDGGPASVSGGDRLRRMRGGGGHADSEAVEPDRAGGNRHRFRGPHLARTSTGRTM
jgi:hypothetical protein